MDMISEKRALDKIYKRRDRYEIPDWQRTEVWSTDQKRKLIDSILQGWKLPKFYFQKTRENPDEFDVVDGQQRLAAIWEFMDGDLKLSAEQAAQFGGADYESLPEALSDLIDDYEIEYDVITNATDEEIKEFFQRLQEGLPLTSSEKLNSVHSKLRDYCVSAAKQPFFRETVSIADKRYSHFDIMSKVVCIEIEGIDAGLRFEDVKKVFSANKEFSPQSAVAKRINAVLKTLHDTFPADSALFRNRTIIQSIVTLVCHLRNAGMKPGDESILREFLEHFTSELRKQIELGQRATEPDFIDFQRTVNANVKSGARTRQSVLLRQLFRLHPTFYTAVNKSADITSGLSHDRSKIASLIRSEISSLNDKYAGVHGHDLFKPTNKSATALAALGNPVASLDDYKRLIEGLYFVFRESLGQRLEGNIPSSFKEVNDLRTMLQHDVDHGDAKKAAKKRKHLASVFAKYSGSSSPDTLDPSVFQLVQVNLLSALSDDLIFLGKNLVQ